MNKSNPILERAMLRLAEAEKAIRVEKQKKEMAQMIAQSIVDNDIYFFIDPDTNDLIISSLKNVRTIR